MAREDVNIKVSANVAEAIRLWKAMESGPQGMANELDALGKKGKAAGDGMAASFEKLVGKWTSIGAAIAAAKKLLDEFTQFQAESLKKTTDVTTSIDTRTRELFLLADGKRAYEDLRNRVLDIAVKRNAAPGQAFDAAAALAGAGYSMDQVLEGGATDAMLRIQSANAARGQNVDVRNLTDALTGFLDATGQAKTAENLLRAGVVSQNLWAATKLNISDMDVMASRAAAVHGATGMGNEMLAVMSMFRDITDPSTGATAFRGGTLKLAGAANKKRARALLGELGLTPEDVDFQGESFFDVQKLLAQKFEAAGPNAARIASGLFGEESILFYNTLLNQKGVAETQRRVAMGQDVGGFNAAASVIEGGYQAAAAGAESREALAFFQKGMIDPTVVRRNLLSRIRQEGYTRFDEFAAAQTFDVLNYLTGEPAFAADRAARVIGGTSRQREERSRRILEQSAAESVRVRVEIVDQNKIAIPNKSRVEGLSKPNRTPAGR